MAFRLKWNPKWNGIASLNLYKLLSPNAFEQLQYSTVERDNIRKNCTFIFDLPKKVG